MDARLQGCRAFGERSRAVVKRRLEQADPCLRAGKVTPVWNRRPGQGQDVNHAFQFLPELDQPGQRIRLSSPLRGHG